MITRTRQKTWTFVKPFQLRGIDHVLPAGDYEVTTEEELIESLSFPVYRRVGTTILVPAQARSSSVEMFSIDPADLKSAHENHASDDALPQDKAHAADSTR